MKNILVISRPRFWIYTAGPFWLCAALLYPLGIHVQAFLIMLVYFTFPANILIYGINDIYDREIDVLNAKKQGYEQVLEKKFTHKLVWVILFSNIPFIIYAYMMLPQNAFFALLFFIFLAWQYSAYPLRAKAKPFLDSFVSALLYIVPASVAWAVVTNSVGTIWPLLAGCLWAYAMHMYSAVPDITADKAGGITTSATLLGKNYALLVCSILYTLAAVIAYQFVGVVSFGALFVYLFLMFLSYKKRTPEAVLSLYVLFPYVNTVIGIVLFFILFFK